MKYWRLDDRNIVINLRGGWSLNMRTQCRTKITGNERSRSRYAVLNVRGNPLTATVRMENKYDMWQQTRMLTGDIPVSRGDDRA